MRNEFYKDAQGAILAFDVGDRESFERLGGWLDESARFGLGHGAVVVVAANKTDVGDRSRAVKEAEGRAWVGGADTLWAGLLSQRGAGRRGSRERKSPGGGGSHSPLVRT